ncbi:hypothetical protein ACJIZ3_019367 [Penstemon smallii]|uniref:Uncharacterized protein n=1 Tax=Penstemon smallii TaxID=265156 RepID=A0ABD3T1H4_9LAMI
MTAETEVSKEVASIEEKCGLDMSSYQDLPKLDSNGISRCDQINDPDNSYVFVTGDDGVIDDPVVSKEDVAVAAEGLSVESESRKLDVVNEEVSESLKVGGNEDLEKSNVDPHVVNGNGVPSEQDRSPGDEDGAQAFVADATGEQKPKIESLGEADVEQVEDLNETLVSSTGAEIEKVADQNGKIEGVAENEFKQFEDPNGSCESFGGAEIEKAADKNEKIEGAAEIEIKLVEDSNGGLESSVEDNMQKVDQNGKIEGDVEIEIKQDSNISLESSTGVDIEKVTEKNGKIEGITEIESMQVEDLSSSIQSSAGAEMEKLDDQNGKFEGVAENEIKQVEDLNGSLTSSIGAEIETVGAQNGNLPNVDETETKQVVVPSSSIVSSEGAEIEKLTDENGKIEGVGESEIKQVEDSNERLKTSTGARTETAGDQNRKVEDVLEIGIKQVEYLNGSLASSAGAEIETAGAQNVNLPNVDETETKQVVDPSSSIESSAGAEIKKLTDENGKIEGVGESEIKQVEDSNERLKSLTGAKTETETVGDQNGNLPNVDETEIKQVENPNGRLESLVGAEIETTGDNNGNTEDAAEMKIKEVDDLNGKLGSFAGSEMEMVADQNARTELFVETEEKKVEDQTKSDPSHQESQVGTRSLVAESEENKELNNLSSHFSELGNAHDECEDQNNLHSSERIEVCCESQNVVVDAVDSEMQEVSTEDQNEIKLAREMLETVEHKAPLATSIDSDLEAHPIINKEGIHLDVMENQKGKTAPVPNAEVGLEQVKEAKNVVDSDEQHVETVCELVLEEKVEEDSSVSHVEDSVQNAEEPEKHTDNNKVAPEIIQSEAEDFVLTQSLPASDAHEPEIEIGLSDAETVGISSSPVDGPKSHAIENDLSGHDSNIRRTTIGASSGPNSVIGIVICTEKEPNFQGSDAHVETEVSSVNGPPAAVNVKLEPKVHESSAASSEGMTSDVTVTCRKEILDSSGASNIVLETTDVKDMGDQLDSSTGSNDENLFLQENEDVGNVLNDSISVASPEDFSTAVISGEDTNIAAATKPFNYLIRIPRFNDENLKEQIRLAKLQVDEKTKMREAIQVQIQEKRASSQIHGIDYEYAKGEERNARKLVRSKRMEIDSLQSMINKAKNAISIEDIDYRIYNMEHMIQHETLPLKEEKQLIREIKQLKQLREQLSSNMGSQDEIKQALEQREEVEERLKIARKELDILKGKVLKAEAAFVEAQMKYNDENKKVRELQAQFRAADDIRQEAYVRWQSLRKELAEKNKHFFKGRDDLAAANNYAFSRDREALYRLCTNQVEKVMELWNTNDEFRKEYVSFNVRSTVRRLGTLDGRSLGPDEEPPILPSYVDDRVDRRVSKPAKVDPVPQSLPELKLETSVEKGTSEDKSKTKATEHKSQTKIVLEIGLATESSRDIPDEVQEEPVKSKEEIELAKKAEQMRKEEAEAKLKEQRRLEELAKANEARERKKRQAEKLQMRAELKAQKEAEQKEKEREKRLRKKEKKKVDVNDSKSNCDSAPISEGAMEIVKEIEPTKEINNPKKAQKPLKQNKTKSVVPPPALRYRNRKKWQQYMWLAATSLAVFALFWLGNIGMFSNVYLKRPSSGY